MRSQYLQELGLPSPETGSADCRLAADQPSELSVVCVCVCVCVSFPSSVPVYSAFGDSPSDQGMCAYLEQQCHPGSLVLGL